MNRCTEFMEKHWDQMLQQPNFERWRTTLGQTIASDVSRQAGKNINGNVSIEQANTPGQVPDKEQGTNNGPVENNKSAKK